MHSSFGFHSVPGSQDCRGPLQPNGIHNLSVLAFPLGNVSAVLPLSIYCLFFSLAVGGRENREVMLTVGLPFPSHLHCLFVGGCCSSLNAHNRERFTSVPDTWPDQMEK